MKTSIVKQTVFLLFSICTLGFFIRIYLLDQIPNSISDDEAAFGYNAFSILKTGRDEFGLKYPLYFRSFDDYKNPFFVYLLLPFIALLGLTEWAIRLPSVFTGVMVIPIFFLLSQKLINNFKLSLFCALFAGISPWLIQYSRVAIEVETALFLTLFGVWLFLKGKNHKFFYIVSAFIFGLAFYTYYSSKIWVVLFGTVLLIFNKVINRFVFLGSIVFILMTVPYLQLLKDANIALRPFAVSVFSNQEEKNKDSQLILFDNTRFIPFGHIVHNRRFTPINQAVNGYLHILNPQILFSQSPHNQISSSRLFYIWQLPLIVIGFLHLFRQKNLWWFVLLWLFIGFIPGGLTNLPIFDRRIFLNSFPLIFVASFGLFKIFKIHNKKVLKIMATFFIATSLYFYLHNYFIHGQVENVFYWGSGMKELVTTTSQEKEKHEKVVVSLNFDRPISFFLFYEQYSPQKYLDEGGTISGGYLDERNKFDKYNFKNITKEELSLDTLYVWEASEFQPCLEEKYTILRSDTTPLGKIGFYNPNMPDCKNWLKV